MRIGQRPLVLVALLGAACPGGNEDEGDDDGMTGVEPFFPENYESTYTEVRNCRGSGDHDLNNIRILVDAAARGPYESRMEPFPVDAVVLKVEYDFGDVACAGEIKQWTAMKRLPTDSSPDTLDWEWQQVDFDRRVVEVNKPACIGCHTGCGVPPDGHDWTCSIPP